MRCKIKPLDKTDDRGFWTTSMRHIPAIEPLRVNAVFGCGAKKPFLLIESEDGKKDLAAYSLKEESTRIWGTKIEKEELVRVFIKNYLQVLIDHWNGDNDSIKLIQTVGDK